MRLSHVVPRSRGLLLGGTWLRVVTRWRASELDAALASGADPTQSDALSLRAGQLRAPALRQQMQRSLQAALDLADLQRAAAWCPPPLVRSAELLACEGLVAALIARLADPHSASVQGLAVTSMLLRERQSPLFRGDTERSLADHLRWARATL